MALRCDLVGDCPHCYTGSRGHPGPAADQHSRRAVEQSRGLGPAGHRACSGGPAHTTLTCHVHTWGVFLSGTLSVPGRSAYSLFSGSCALGLGLAGPGTLGRLLAWRAQHWGPQWGRRACRFSQVQAQEHLRVRRTGRGLRSGLPCRPWEGLCPSLSPSVLERELSHTRRSQVHMNHSAGCLCASRGHSGAVSP